MDVRIRPASPADHREVLRIWRRAVEATHTFLTASDVDHYEAIVADQLPRLADLRVAVRGDDLFGFIAHDEGEVGMLFVAPEARGGGVGTALLEDVAADREVLRLDVNEQNPAALGFYLSRGFEPVGRSSLDGEGRPFPIVHLRRARSG